MVYHFQLHGGSALRRFKQENPEFCGWGSHSAKLVVTWTVRCAAAGYPIPAAAAAAHRIRFDMSRAVDAVPGGKNGVNT